VAQLMETKINERNRRADKSLRSTGTKLKASVSRKFVVSQQLTTFCRSQTLKTATCRNCNSSSDKVSEQNIFELTKINHRDSLRAFQANLIF
jgi:hypothetical protein